MVEKLINKIIREAEEKGRSIVEEAGQKLQAAWAKEQARLKEAYQARLEQEKQELQRRTEIETTNVRLQNEQAVLAAKNRYLEEIWKTLEGKFDDFVERHFPSLLQDAVQGLENGSYTVRIPARLDFAWKDSTSKKVKVVKDEAVRNGFVIESGPWVLRFNWENIRQVLFSELVEEINRHLFGT